MKSSFYSKIIMILIAFTIFSCVPARKMQDVKAKYDRAKSENAKCQEELSQALRQNNDFKEEINKLEKSIAKLVKDTSDFRSRYRQIEKLNKRLNELYEQVIAQNKSLLTNSSSQNQMLTMDLENKKRDLELKERALALREQEVNRLKEDLKEREQKVNELQEILDKKDRAVRILKKKIADALQGFKSSELTVKNKNGKVYVSMSENLLFSSGSTVVGAKGISAVKKVAAVLKKTRSVNILVEGHTDNVPMNGRGEIKDNLDLSVIRATSIARILINAGVKAKRVTSAGRGEHFPVAKNDSAIGRAKNRRTEIILTPKLDELFKILESN